MLELASLCVNVLHNRAVEFAKKYNVPIHVRNSAHNRKGTMIVAATESMERIVVSGAALKEELARVSLTKVPDRPGVVARVFHTMAKHDIMVDDIIQTVNDDKTASLSFTVDLAEFSDAKNVCGKLAKSLKCNVSYDDSLEGQRSRRRNASSHRRSRENVQRAGRRENQHRKHHHQRNQNLLHDRTRRRKEGAAIS